MNKNHTIGKLLASIVLFSVIFLLLVPNGSGGAYPGQGNAPQSGNMIAGIRSEPAGLDPADTTNLNTLLVTNQIYDTLVRYAQVDSIPIPGLASSWSTSTDGLTWTFSIRPGILFHDGTALDADAVLYNINRWWDPAHPFHTGSFEYFYALFGGFKGDPNSLISSLSTDGSQQIFISLTRSSNSLPSILALPSFAIASPAAIQAGTLSDAPVGSGAFRFGEWISGDHIRLDSNADYWGGKPPLDSLTFKVIPDDTVRLTALQNNTIHTAAGLPNNYTATALTDPNLKVIFRPSDSIGYLGINRSHAPLDNPLIREAIAHAINRPQLITDQFGPGYLAASQFLPPNVFGYNPSVPGYDYNPALASSLLAQAGYSPDVPIVLAYRNVVRGYLPNPGVTAVAIRNSLQAVGFNVEVVVYDSSDLITKALNGELDLFLLGWMADYQHPDNYLSYHFCNSSNMGFGPIDPTLCGLIDSAMSTPNVNLQKSFFESASMRIVETLPVVPLAHQTTLLVTRRNVAGLTSGPHSIDWYGKAYFATDWVFLPMLTR